MFLLGFLIGSRLGGFLTLLLHCCVIIAKDSDKADKMES